MKSPKRPSLVTGISCLLWGLLVLLAVVLVMAPAAGPHNCGGMSYRWTGKANSNAWNAAKNWDPNGVPGNCANDNASIQPNSAYAFPNLVIPGPTTLQSLSLSTPRNEGTVTLSGGSLTVTRSFNWSGNGTLSTPVTTPPAAAADIIGPGRKLIQSAGAAQVNVSLAGATTVSGSGLSLSGTGATIINTGTFTLQPGAIIASQDCCAGLATFVNRGTVAVPSSPQGGKAVVTGTAFNDAAAGTVMIGSGAVLEFQVAPADLAAGVTFGGGGTFLTDDTADVRLAGDVNLAGGTTFGLGVDQNSSGATLSGFGTLRGNGTFSWTGGTLAANLTVAGPVKTKIAAARHMFLDATQGPGSGTLVVGGNTTLSGDGLIMKGAAHLINTGDFTPQAGSAISALSCCVHPAELANKGTLTLNVGARNAFRVPAPGWPGVAFTNSATVDLKSGTFRFGAPGYIQSGGNTTLGGGSLESASPSSAAVKLLGGTLAGAGTITAAVLNKKATIDPGTVSGSAGVITVKGNYTQASTATLRVDIKGGARAGDNFSQLAVRGTAKLGGTLAYTLVNDFRPAGTALFPLITYMAHSGRFRALDPDAGSPRRWVDYKPASAVFSLQGPWGIDTSGNCGDTDTPAACPPRITAAAYRRVSSKMGTPDFWGRYIGDSRTTMKNGECVPAAPSNRYAAMDITPEEVAAAARLKLPILPVYFNYDAGVVDAADGAQCGKNLATAAIEFAQHLHVPGGTAIFVDIEYNVHTSKEFIKGWYDRFNTSFSYQSPYGKKVRVSYQAGVYKAGYLASTTSRTTNFSAAYCAAVAKEPAIGTQSFIWTTTPVPGWSTKADEPEWKARGPSCRGRTVAWQYDGGTASEPPGDVNTDEAVLPDLPLWKP